MIDLVRADLGQDLKGKKIAVLGAAFKPDSDDVRDSPALDIAAQIAEAGAQVVIHDPKAIENARRRFPSLSFATEILDCISQSDAILHLTEWKSYRELEPRSLKQHVKQAIIIDGRNALDRDRWISAGWKFRALGRATR
jgi:UDPglucose 6-dehydrogenase